MPEQKSQQFEIEYQPGTEVVDPEHGRGEIVEALMTMRLSKDKVARVSISYKCEFANGDTAEYDHISIANFAKKQEEKEEEAEGYVC